MSIYKEIEDLLRRLYESISPTNLDEWYEDVKKVIGIFIRGEEIREFLKKIECVKKELEQERITSSDTKENIRKINFLISQIKSKEPDFLLERLKQRGYETTYDSGLKNAFKGQALRILELTRLGKKDMVVQTIVRTYVAQRKPVPSEIIDALKNEYNIEQFKAFIYAFLAGITNIKEE